MYWRRLGPLRVGGVTIAALGEATKAALQELSGLDPGRASTSMRVPFAFPSTPERPGCLMHSGATEPARTAGVTPAALGEATKAALQELPGLDPEEFPHARSFRRLQGQLRTVRFV
jgi:hypothetical protein